MLKFEKLSRLEMKNVIGGGEAVGKECSGTVTCADGFVQSGAYDCTDFVHGADGEAVCQALGHGSSISCDCNGGGGGTAE